MSGSKLGQSKFIMEYCLVSNQLPHPANYNQKDRTYDLISIMKWASQV